MAPDDPLFRSELKMPLRLQPLSRAVSNARNKDLQVLQGAGDVCCAWARLVQTQAARFSRLSRGGNHDVSD